MSATGDHELDQLVAFDLAYRAVEDDVVELLAKAGLAQEHFPTFGKEPKWPHEALPHERPRLPFKSVARRVVKAHLSGFRAMKINLLGSGEKADEQLAFTKPISNELQLLFGFEHDAPYEDSFTVYIGALVTAGDLEGETRVTTLEFLLADRAHGDRWHFTGAAELNHALEQALTFVRGIFPFWEDRLRKHLVPVPTELATVDAFSAREAYDRAMSHAGDEMRHAVLVEVETHLLCPSRELEIESCDARGRLLPWGAWRFAFESDDRQTEFHMEVPSAGKVRQWAIPNGLHLSLYPHGRAIPDGWRDSTSAMAAALAAARLSKTQVMKRRLHVAFQTETPDDDEDEDVPAPPVVPTWLVRMVDPHKRGRIVKDVVVSFDA